MAQAAAYRVCAETGLKIDGPAETLIKVNAVVAVVFLALGGFLGLLVALTRWPAVHLLSVDAFYMVLTAHGINVLIFWIIFFEIAVLYFASAILLNCRLATPRIAWLAFMLMIAGAVMNNIAVFQGESSVMFTSYVPMPAQWHFYLGLILFAVGALVAVCVFFGTLVIARMERTYEGSVPLVTFGAITAAIIAVFSIVSGALALIPAFLWSIGLVSHVDSLMYRVIWWGLGHSSQQINVAAHVSVWYLIAALVIGAKPLSEKVSRMAFFLYIAFLQIASAHHILADPGISSEWKVFNTSYAMYLAVLGSMIHGLSIPGAIEAAQRRNGFTQGIFGWLRKAPWGNPAFAALVLSVAMFGIAGGITGVVLGAEQLNLLMHNTLYVPGHFHATVVAGTTLAFMGITYPLVPLIFQREIIWPTLAKWQPYLFGLGALGISLFMMGAGTLGVSRRNWGIEFSDLTLPYEYPPTAALMLGLNGVSALLASIGGVLFVVVIVASILFGKRRGAEEIKYNPVVFKGGGVAAATAHGSEATLKLPGTVILVTVFFVCFILYYYINWKYLSEVWPLR
jgi:cytochrome c oxidase subunit 1